VGKGKRWKVAAGEEREIEGQKRSRRQIAMKRRRGAVGGGEGGEAAAAGVVYC